MQWMIQDGSKRVDAFFAFAGPPLINGAVDRAGRNCWSAPGPVNVHSLSSLTSTDSAARPVSGCSVYFGTTAACCDGAFLHDGLGVTQQLQRAIKHATRSWS